MEIRKREKKKKIKGVWESLPVCSWSIPGYTQSHCDQDNPVTVDGSSGKTRRSSAARMMAGAGIICARTILPGFGSRAERKPPIFLPTKLPKKPAMTSKAMTKEFSHERNQQALTTQVWMPELSKGINR